VASIAATPQSIGVSENTYDPELMRGSAPVEGAAQGGASAQGNAKLAQQVDQLTEQVAKLEKISANQMRALRGMLELMVEKGLLTREEYLAKIRVRAE
jgi:type IV pilus assembly protein PilB